MTSKNTDLELLTMRRLQTCKARGGVAWSCDLLYDGSKIGTAHNGGNGGATRFHHIGRDGRTRIDSLEKAAADATGETSEALDLLLCCMTPKVNGKQAADLIARAL